MIPCTPSSPPQTPPPFSPLARRTPPITVIGTEAIRQTFDAGCLRQAINSRGQLEEVPAHGPGNVVFASLSYENIAEVFTSFGRMGASAEHVANEVIDETRSYLGSDVLVEKHFAEQLMLPLGICAWQAGSHQRGRSFRTPPLNRHSTTHIELLRQILGIQIDGTRVQADHADIVTLAGGRNQL